MEDSEKVDTDSERGDLGISFGGEDSISSFYEKIQFSKSPTCFYSRIFLWASNTLKNEGPVPH